MARRALEFAQAHPQTDTGYTAVVTRLQQEVTQADTAGVQQDSGIEREHAAIGRRTILRDAVRSQHLVRLSRIVKRAAKEHPELYGRFTLPTHNTPNRGFLNKAKSMLATATEMKDVLGTLGLGDTFIDELTQAVAALEGATTDAHVARNDHVGASAQLDQIASVAAVDVSVLDTFVKRIYGNDPMTMAAWQSAKNIAGPFRKGEDEATPEPAPEPAPAPEPVAPPPVPPVPSPAGQQ
jgi:hypothetical protein